MNLVQIQERIKGLPIQLLQQYANGMNPEVPPYVALSVLKQKEAEMQQHANAQGAAQGQMPSVKSQLEQKVGTLQQQASMMPQGMGQPAAPAPQGPVQMAGGGLTSGNAGASMRFAEGGIIGFKDGGKGDKYETEYDRKRREEQEEGTAGLGNALLYGSAPVAAAGDIAALPVSLLRNMFYNGQGDAPGWTPFSDMRARTLANDRMDNAVARNAATNEDTAAPTDKDVMAAIQNQARPAGRVPAAPQQGLGSATLASNPGKLVGGMTLDQAIATARNRNAQSNIPFTAEDESVLRRRFAGAEADPTKPSAPRPAPPGAPGTAGLGSSSVAAMLQKQLGKETPVPTAEGAAKSVQDINKQFGLDVPGGKEEREMIAKMKADRAAQTQDRSTQNLINFLVNAKGSNLGETFASGARSSMSEIEKQRADDMAHSQKLYEMVSGLNKSDRAEKVGSAGKAATLFGEEQKAAADADRNRLTSLANIYHTDVASAAQIQAQKIAAAARSGSMDDKQQLAELKALQASIQAQIKLTPYDKKVVGPLQEQLATINAQIAQMAGVGTIGAAPGASKLSAADQALIDKYQKK